MASEAERYPLQTDEDIAYAIKQSCLDLGFDPGAAQKMADRAVALRQKKHGPNPRR